MTQPADLIKKVPNINKIIRNKLGSPFVNIKKALRVGHNSSAVPIGLSALINLKKLKNLFLCNISIQYF